MMLDAWHGLQSRVQAIICEPVMQTKGKRASKRHLHPEVIVTQLGRRYTMQCMTAGKFAGQEVCVNSQLRLERADLESPRIHQAHLYSVPVQCL